MIIGIDFSINSTSVCIRGEETHFFSFVPNYRKDLSGFKTHNLISDLVHIVSYRKESPSKNSIEDQSIKLSNADVLSHEIMSKIKPFVKGIPDIRIEGFSFGSKGNSFIDLITYNTFLKVKMIREWGHCISVISPKTNKKLFTGNGNASKCDMLRRFLQTESPLSQRLIEMNLNKEGEFTIPKPIDDVVDSWALTEILSNRE
jgi:hypothetical protein